LIGIDIVDLEDPILKVRKPEDFRFIRHPEEKVLNHPMIFWLYWTAKEAVFKASRDLVRFQPKKIEIKLDPENLRFTAKHNSLVFHGSFEVNENYALSFCHPPHLEVTYEVCHAQKINWPKYIRSIACDNLRKIDANLEIASDDDGLPIISEINLPISFSHHYHKGAYIHPLWHK
jgi:phosphopantetheinyl transferase (holo-ACP synthase)